MDAVEIARIIEAATEELRLFGSVSQHSKDALRDADVGIRGFTASQKAANSDLRKSFGGLADSFVKGEKGTAAFNGTIETATAALGLMIIAMGPFSIAARVAAAAVTLLGKGFAKVNEHNDRMLKGFQALSESGAIASDGLKGLYDNLYDLNLNVQEFDKFAQLMGQNSETLALFGNTTFEGRRALSALSDAMKPVRLDMMNMGITLESQREGMLAYVKLQSQIGMAQKRNGETDLMRTLRLNEGSNRYLMEMDALTKATGVQRKEMESEMERARSEQRFRAKLDAMRASGDERQVKAANELELANSILAKQAPETAQGFRDAASGFISSEAAGKFFLGTMGEGSQVMQDLTNNSATAGESLQKLYGAFGRTTKEFNQIAQVGAYDSFGNFAEQSNLAVRGMTNLPAAIEAAKKQQEELARNPDKRLNALNNNYLNQLELTRAAENTLEIAAEEAAISVNALSTAAVAAAEALGLIGKKTPKPAETGAPTAVAATEKARAERGKADTAAVKVADLNDEIKNAGQEVENLERSKASAEIINTAKAKLADLQKQKVAAEEEEIKQARVASQAALEAKNERLRMRKVQNSIPLLEKDAVSAQKKIDDLKLEQARLEIKQRDNPEAAPGPDDPRVVRTREATEARKKAEAAAEAASAERKRLDDEKGRAAEEAKFARQAETKAKEEAARASAERKRLDDEKGRAEEAKAAKAVEIKAAEEAAKASAERKRLDDANSRVAEESKAARIAEMKSKEEAAKAKATEEHRRRQQGQASGPGDNRMIVLDREISAAEKNLKEKTDALAESRKKLGKVGEESIPAQTKYTKTVENLIIQAESQGKNVPTGIKDKTGRPTSSAYGIGQFTKGTFETVASKAKPGEALHGKTFEDYKKDTGLQREAMTKLTDMNRTTLSKKGHEGNARNLYLAHFLGGAGATGVLGAPDNTPVERVVSADQIAANGPIFKTVKTVGQLKAWADSKMATAERQLTAKAAKEGVKTASAPGSEEVPAMADGGVVKAAPGGSIVRMGEAGLNEAAIPLKGGMIPVTFGRDFKKVFDQIVYTLGKSNDLLNAKPRTNDIKISGVDQYLKDMTTMIGETQKQKQPDVGQYFKDVNATLTETQKQEKSPQPVIDINDVIRSMSSTNEVLLSSITTKLTTAQDSDRPELERMKAQASVVSQNMFDNYAKVISLATPEIDSLASKESDIIESTKQMNQELAVAISNQIKESLQQFAPQQQATDVKILADQLSAGINELVTEARRGNDNTTRLVQVAQS